MDKVIPKVELGPMMPCELSLLTALVAVHRPQNCVEFGYFKGDSARAILAGLGPEGKLTSYDPTPFPDAPVITDPRFTLVKQSMADVSIDYYDFIFFDASHKLEDSLAAYRRLEFKEDCLIVVHDTGVWKENYFPDQRVLPRDYKGDFIHQPDERKFVRHLQDNGWHRINLGTTVEPRHGLTILQWVD